MSFEKLHKVVTYLLVLCGLGTLAFSGDLPLWIPVMGVGGMAVTWFVQAPRQDTTPLWWFGGLLVLFLFLGFVGFRTGEWLESTVAFAVVMMVSKLFQRHVARDYFQLYALSFLLVVGGAVLNPSLTFAVFFLVYVVVLTLGLVLLHLRRDLEEREEAQAQVEARSSTNEPGLWRARLLVTNRFLTGTSILALLVFAASIVIFFAFPRVGFGFFFSRTRPGPAVAGFSSNVELGHFGTIKDNPTVIARVELPEIEGQIDEPLRLRGISFDSYDGKRWLREKGQRGRVALRTGPNGVRSVMREDPVPNPDNVLVQKIYLEPMRLDVRPIFGHPTVLSMQFEDSVLKTLSGTKRHFYQNYPSEDIEYTGPEQTSFFYTVYSAVLEGTPPGIRSAGQEYDKLIRDAYLQLPNTLDPGVAKLALELTAGSATPYDKARAIEAHLSSTFDYSLQGEKDPKDPLGDFLLRSRSGHCEYFASGMVILLRTLGIPARMVNGFHGGVWNEFGQYYAIRQGDAHAWTEVYFPGYGWLTFEPTPAAGALAPSYEDWFSNFQSWLDAAKLQWYKWVIEYDLEKQWAFFRGIGKSVAGMGEFLPKTSSDSTEPESEDEYRDLFRGTNVSTVLAVVLFLVVALRLRTWWLSRGDGLGQSRDVRQARRAWIRLKRLAARGGKVIPAYYTPDDLWRGFRDDGWESWAQARDVTDALQAVVFGQRTWDSERQEIVERAFGMIQEEVRARRRNGDTMRRAA